jgi:hypothetical protein
VDGTSRVIGDNHARFCERLGVKFPGPTRRRRAIGVPTAEELVRLCKSIARICGLVIHDPFISQREGIKAGLPEDVGYVQTMELGSVAGDFIAMSPRHILKAPR